MTSGTVRPAGAPGGEPAMTFRLVALMSVVLLLSLASFGLLMSHYQDQVMHEVAQTASAVGQATLRTLDLPSGTRVRGVRTAEPGWVADPGSPIDHRALLERLAKARPQVEEAQSRIERVVNDVERLRMDSHVRIHETQDLSLGHARAPVSSGGDQPLFDPRHPATASRRNRGRVIG